MDYYQELLDPLIGLGKDLFESGLVSQTSGNLSVRAGEVIAITSSGANLGKLSAENISLVDLQGNPLESTEANSGKKPSKELGLHLAFYRKNPGHTAVVHTHSLACVAVSCIEPWSNYSAIPPLSVYSVMRLGQVPLIEFYPPGAEGLGHAVEALAFDFRAALLANHGAVVSGTSVEHALDGMDELEQACHIYLSVQGKMGSVIPENQARALATQYGNEWSSIS